MTEYFAKLKSDISLLRKNDPEAEAIYFGIDELELCFLEEFGVGFFERIDNEEDDDGADEEEDDADNSNENNHARHLNERNNNLNSNHRNMNRYYLQNKFYFYIGTLLAVMRDSIVVKYVYICSHFLKLIQDEELQTLLFEIIGTLPNLEHFELSGGSVDSVGYDSDGDSADEKCRISWLADVLERLGENQTLRNVNQLRAQELLMAANTAQIDKSAIRSPQHPSSIQQEKINDTRIYFHSLKSFSLHNANFIGNKQEFDYFFRALRQCNQLRQISFYMISFPKNIDLNTLFESISALPKLENIEIHDSIRKNNTKQYPLSPGVLYNFGNRIRENLHFLDLSKNSFGDELGVAIINGLMSEKLGPICNYMAMTEEKNGKEKQNMKQRQLTTEGIIGKKRREEMISKGINTTLASSISALLSPSSQPCPKSSVFVASISVLKELHLQDNDLGTKTCIAISNVLKTNTTLKHLDLESNPNIGSRGVGISVFDKSYITTKEDGNDN